jgi:hypothetical protein
VARVLCAWLIVAGPVAARPAALTPEILQSTRAVPPHVAGRFRDARAFQQSAAGQHYVFDRRAHRVYGVDDSFESAWQASSRSCGRRSGRHRSIAAATCGVSFADPYTYVFDAQGDKIRTVQFLGAELMTPTGLFFTAGNRLLVTPGLFEFDPWPTP